MAEDTAPAEDRPFAPSPDLAAVLSRHAPGPAHESLGEEACRDLESTGSTSVQAIAVVGDLRLSGILLREAVSPALYARFVVGFTEAVRSLSADNRGWFDKFTGDGFLAFWLYPDESQLPSEVVLDFCQSVLPASARLVTNLRRNSRNFPAGVGLTLGLDAGPCELVRIGDSVTVLGSPVVGATRMASGTPPGEVILNVHLGDLLGGSRRPLEARGLRLARVVVRTKEYPDGQEAYRLVFPEEPAPSARPADGVSGIGADA
jgi:class 3 adenylate cyclase